MLLLPSQACSAALCLVRCCPFEPCRNRCTSMLLAALSGGTESILLAVKASRDYMVARRGITAPEMVIGPSAHAAYFKAAEYFNIKLVMAPLGKDLRCAEAHPPGSGRTHRIHVCVHMFSACGWLACIARGNRLLCDACCTCVSATGSMHMRVNALQAAWLVSGALHHTQHNRGGGLSPRLPTWCSGRCGRHRSSGSKEGCPVPRGCVFGWLPAAFC